MYDQLMTLRRITRDLQEERWFGHEGEGLHVVVDRVVAGGAPLAVGRAADGALVGEDFASFFLASDSSSLVFNMDVQKCIEMITQFIHVSG
ncbi:hypothetical protein OIU77_005725 [Salix suchowensis]|uniref:Uncharacterized protein n=1 Tax=Salix suchowensis TaxID=1278906 RepID=A0ABQ9AQK8_9ROSI|nr:hypothetical protein OIU77_005725 [Salix suchowensis]